MRSRHPTRWHFVSSQAAECYACLVALQDEEANVLASEMCTPFMHALENEYGELDANNVQMRAWLKHGHPTRQYLAVAFRSGDTGSNTAIGCLTWSRASRAQS